MATAAITRVGSQDDSVLHATWTLTSADATGDPVSYPEWADITWVVQGTWGGATLKINGGAIASSIVTTTGLSNAAGGAEASASADKVFMTIERPLYVRPALTTVGSGASVIVTALMRRANPMRQ